jgi:hypothetical protein
VHAIALRPARLDLRDDPVVHLDVMLGHEHVLDHDRVGARSPQAERLVSTPVVEDRQRRPRMIGTSITSGPPL